MSPKAASAQSCTLEGGIRGTCKASAGANEVDSDPGFSDYFLTGCSSGRCILTQGSGLCAGIARAIDTANNNAGSAASYNDYVCATNVGDCVANSTIQGYSGANLVCPAGQVCCKAKTGPPTSAAGGSAAAGAAGAKATAQTAKQLPDPLGGVNIPTFIGNVIRTFAGIAGTIALCMFVYGGIMLIMSGGEQAKVQNGKKILVNASIGLLLIFSAYTFVSAIIGAILAE